MEPNETSAEVPVTQAPPRSRSRVGTRIVMVFALLALVGLGVFIGARVKQALAKREALASERVEAQASAVRKAPAMATHPEPARWKAHVDLTGTLKPWRDAEVGFETTGRLVRILVATGDTVKQGQVLALLDGSRAAETVAIKDATVRAMQANLALAEDQAKRTESLVASRSIPEAQAEQARQQVALTKANLQASQADAQFARTGAGQHAITAPFAGIVTRAPTAAGGVVQPGAPLVHIEDLSRLRLSATVSEEDAPLMRIGQSATVKYRDRSVIAKVVSIVPSLDQSTRRAPVELEVPNDPSAPLLAWSFVHASVDGQGEVAAVRVPATARRPGSQDEIVKIEKGKARIVRVMHAVDADGSWIVREGLTTGDLVLVAPGGEIKEGDILADVETIESARSEK